MRLKQKIKTILLARKILDALPDPQIMKEKITSRKFWALIAGAAMVSFGDQLGLSPDTTQYVVQLVVAYIIGQGAVDAVSSLKSPAK